MFKYADFNRDINKIRKNLDLSWTELAERMGLTVKEIKKVNIKTDPKIIFSLAGWAGLNVNKYVLNSNIGPFTKEANNPLTASPEPLKAQKELKPSTIGHILEEAYIQILKKEAA